MSRPASPSLNAPEPPRHEPASPALSSSASSAGPETFADALADTHDNSPALASAQASEDGDKHTDEEGADVGDTDTTPADAPADADAAPADSAHSQDVALPSGLVETGTLADPPPSPSSSRLPTTIDLERTATPPLDAVPRGVLPSASKPRPSSTLSTLSLASNLSAGEGRKPQINRLSLSFEDDDLPPSPSSDANAKRPFSLSSEPETPTAPSASSSPSSARPRPSLLHHAGDPTLVGRDASPSLTQAVWRQSLHLASSSGGGGSPLGTPTRGVRGLSDGEEEDDEGEEVEVEGVDKVRMGNGMTDVRLDDPPSVEGDEGVSTPRGAAEFAPSCAVTVNGSRRASGANPHRRSISDSALPPGPSSSSSSAEGGDADEAEAEARDALGRGPPPSARLSAGLGPPPARDRQPSIATPHAADGFLSHRASANLSSLASSSAPPGGEAGGPLGRGARREMVQSFEAARRREASAGEGGEGAEGTEGRRGSLSATDWDFWGRVMNDYELVAREQPRELSRAIQKGIPQALRGMVWQLMAAAKDSSLEFIYSELLKKPSPHEKSIARDLSRTFPKHEYFAEAGGVGQGNLFNVVKAYSLYDDEVGYTQGLQFIVGPLLLNMPDEEAFCVLVRLMSAYDLRSHYTPNMPGLQLRLFQFDRLVEELLPGVFLHMLRQGVKSSMYASQWFLTLFGYRFPLELVSAVFDLVFAEGVEAVFRFAVALLKRNEHHLCQLEFEDLIEFLKNGLFEGYAPDPEDLARDPDALYKVHDFVREALQVRITPLMLDQFGEEWRTLCAQQTAHAAELDALRKANLQLSFQVRQLEASLAQVNQEHVELVKQVVAGRLEREELEDELVKYKLAYADLSHAAAMSPLQARRQSELSIASSIGLDDASSSSSTAATSAASSSVGGGGGLSGLAGMGIGMGIGGGRWFGGGSGGAAPGTRVSSSAMSARSASQRSENGY
ncbi:hypothetical protein JCM10207_005596 [Rhodosporidiobolus poonsookiae]